MMTYTKAKEIERLRLSNHSWRRISELICDQFPDEDKALAGNQMHGIELCTDAMVFLSGVAKVTDVSNDIRKLWET